MKKEDAPRVGSFSIKAASSAGFSETSEGSVSFSGAWPTADLVRLKQAKGRNFLRETRNSRNGCECGRGEPQVLEWSFGTGSVCSRCPGGDCLLSADAPYSC